MDALKDIVWEGYKITEVERESELLRISHILSDPIDELHYQWYR